MRVGQEFHQGDPGDEGNSLAGREGFRRLYLGGLPAFCESGVLFVAYFFGCTGSLLVHADLL